MTSMLQLQHQRALRRRRRRLTITPARYAAIEPARGGSTQQQQREDEGDLSGEEDDDNDGTTPDSTTTSAAAACLEEDWLVRRKRKRTGATTALWKYPHPSNSKPAVSRRHRGRRRPNLMGSRWRCACWGDDYPNETKQDCSNHALPDSTPLLPALQGRRRPRPRLTGWGRMILVYCYWCCYCRSPRTYLYRSGGEGGGLWVQGWIAIQVPSKIPSPSPRSTHTLKPWGIRNNSIRCSPSSIGSLTRCAVSSRDLDHDKEHEEEENKYDPPHQRQTKTESALALDLLQQQLRQQQEQINTLIQLLQKQQLSAPIHPAPTIPSPQFLTVVDDATSQDSDQQQPKSTVTFPAASTTAVVQPLKAMLFIDGTWLYYSIYERPQRDCPLVQKYGRGWQLRYRLDWTKLPAILSRQLVGLIGGSTSTTRRPIEIVRASVYTSYKADTSPQSYRYKLFESLRAANYDVHMMETVGKSEKCVDIQLAVEVLHYATTEQGSSYDVALLLTGDKDFIPAMIRTRQKGKAVGLVSMKRGCNRALIETPGLRDFDVLWLEDYLDEFVVPLHASAGRDKTAAHGSSSPISLFTLYKVLFDFCAASDSPRVSSRDAGRYLKHWTIAGMTLLEEIKRHYVGLYQFLSSSGLFVLEHDPNKADKSYWLSLSPEAPELLRRQAQQQQQFSPEEREFFRHQYNSTILVTEADLFYQRTRLLPAPPPPTTTLISVVGMNSQDNNDSVATDGIDYHQLKVADLRAICRKHGLAVSGVKATLVERIGAHLAAKQPNWQPPQHQQQQQSTDTTDPSMARLSQEAPDKVVQNEFLQALIVEYLHARGGRASSRDLGRYLAAYPASSSSSSDGRQYPSALMELKETTRGGLRQFVGQYPERFGLVAGNDTEHEYEFWVSLLANPTIKS